MAVRIITDSASDISQEKAKEWGITVLPLPTRFGEEEYLDGVTISHRMFFEKLIETDVLPQTSQLTPFAYEEAFDRVLQSGDTAVCITLSSRLSGCFQSANAALAGYADRIALVDSENVCIGEHILVELAVRLRAEGKSAAQIAQTLNERKKSIHLIALLDTLEYLQKGGRISSTLAFAGKLLSIKPVIAIENGEVVLLGKARGSKNGNNLLVKLIEETGGIDFSMPYILGYSGLSDTLLQKYINDSKALYENHTDSLPVCSIGSTIGTHVGPGAVAVAFFK